MYADEKNMMTTSTSPLVMVMQMAMIMMRLLIRDEMPRDNDLSVPSDRPSVRLQNLVCVSTLKIDNNRADISISHTHTHNIGIR